MTDSVLGVGAGSQQAALEKEPPPASRRQVPAFLRRSPTLRLFGKRLLMAIPVLLGVSFITFSLMNLLPGDAATAMAGESASKAQLQAMRVRLHLNLPFFDRYIHWLGSALTGQLGTSFASGTSVTSIIGGRLPVTAELVVGAVILSLIFSVPVAL